MSGRAGLGTQFEDDPYIRGKEILSILCMPLIHQGVLRGVLYLENDLAGGRIPFADLSAQPARPKFTRSGDIRRLAPLARAPLLNQPFRLGFQGADPFLGAGVGREKDKGLRIFRRCALGLQGFPNPGRFARIITGRRWCNCRG